jgi:GAF domain-containing protein
MAETILIEGATRSEKYESFLKQLKILIGEEQDLISILSNTTASLKEIFGFFWIGFYIVRGEVLKLGPFQGSIACIEIAFGRGVCGSSWEKKISHLKNWKKLFLRLIMKGFQIRKHYSLYLK